MKQAHITFMTCLFAFCCSLNVDVIHASDTEFVDIKVDSPFKEYLLKKPVLMEFAGAILIRSKDGQKYILGVASTDLRGKTLDIATRILRVKADRSVLELTNGVKMVVEETINTKTTLTLIDGKESGSVIEEYKSVITSEVRGKIRSLPVVGSWYSADKERYFLAVGIVVEKE